LTANWTQAEQEVRLSQGPILYRELGSGEPIVFVHGLLVDGALWRKVVPRLEGEFRCIVPDLPLGSHRAPMRPDADLSPPGLASLLADFISSLDLDGTTLVGNDTGGAICQLVAAHHPERIGRLVLTDCDAYENFLPPAFRYLQVLARLPGGIAAAMQSMRLEPLRRSPIAFGWLTKRPIDRQVVDAWMRPALADRGVRRDVTKVLRGISKRYTLAAADRLRSFDRPVLIAWAPEDRFFRISDGERLAGDIPNARLVHVEDSRTFIPEDQPERLAELIAEFIRDATPGPASPDSPR
jgi:pimeloyl-ACP methyl ester carboxylesterase